MDLQQLLQSLQNHPWALFAAIMILPGLGVPSSPLFLLAGAVWGADARGCAFAIAATAINLWWTHAAAYTAAQKLENHPGILEKIPMPGKIRKLIPKIASLGNTHPYHTTFALRVTPGIPLFVQNYGLGFLRIPTIPYLGISIPLNGIFVIGFVLTGGSLMQGKTGTLIAGIGILLVATLVISKLRKAEKPA